MLLNKEITEGDQKIDFSLTNTKDYKEYLQELKEILEKADKDKYVSDILRSNDNYIVEQLKISDTIINRNAKDLRNELNQKVKTNNIKTTSNVEDKQLELKWDLQSLSNDVPF